MKRKRVSLPWKIVLCTDIVAMLAAAMLAPIYAAYVEGIGGDLLDTGIAASLFAFAAGVTSLLSGRFADRIKHQYGLVGVGYILTGFGFLGYLWVSTVWQLFAVQIFIGLVRAGYGPVFDGLYTRVIGPRHASSRWGFWEAGYYFSGAAGSLIGAIIVTQWSFGALFGAMAALCFISGAYILMARRSM